jgi:alpha-galactosidase
MAKITFLGAGSTIFAKNLLGDILSYPELAGSTITLMDIDPDRLRTTRVVAERTAQALGAHPNIEATLDRRQALDGADYAIAMFQIGGYKPGTVIDFEIPKKYGLRQTIADTLGIGGIFRALRTIPVFLEITQEMSELCPDVIFLNYVNPMAMNTWAIHRASHIKTVGLCHSVQGTAQEIARDIQVPISEINFTCAGINHMAFYLRFERKTKNGVEDLYPRMRQVVAEGRVPSWNRVRYEMLLRLGYFVTESSEHFAEYTPYFIKRDRPDLVEQFNVPLDEYIRRCEVQLAGWEFMQHKIDHPAATEDELRNMMQEKAKVNPYLTPRFIERVLADTKEFESGKIVRSHEYGSGIIHSIETGEPRVVYGNVANNGLIDNLPQGCCVEVPVLVDRSGLQPTKIGALPPQLAAMMQTNINVQALAVEAALTHKKEHIYHAAMLDPHTAAELDLEQIWNLVDDLIEAHKSWLPEYQ